MGRRRSEGGRIELAEQKQPKNMRELTDNQNVSRFSAATTSRRRSERPIMTSVGPGFNGNTQSHFQTQRNASASMIP
jgi:hypothetical protein